MLNEHLGDLDYFMSQNMGIINQITSLYMTNLHHFNGSIDRDDIFQIASIGFIKAYNNFDPINFTNDKGEPLRFSTYAYPMIHGEIKRYLRDFNIGVKVSRSYKEKINKFIFNKLSFDDSYDKIMSIMDWTLEETKDFLIHFSATNCVYLDTPLESHEDETYGNFIEDDKAFSKINDNLIISDFKNFLNSSQLEVYDLLINKGLSQLEAGKIVGVSQVQISRIFSEILNIAEKYGKEEFMGGKRPNLEVINITRSFIYKRKTNIKELHKIIQIKGYSHSYNSIRLLYKKIKNEIDNEQQKSLEIKNNDNFKEILPKDLLTEINIQSENIEMNNNSKTKKVIQNIEKFEEIFIKKNSIPVNSLIDEITRLSNYLNSSEALIDNPLNVSHPSVSILSNAYTIGPLLNAM